MNNEYQIILDAVRQNFASVVWAHKVQEKQADIFLSQYRWIETINIFAGALTSCGIIATIFMDTLVMKVITAVLSFVTLFIAAYFKSFDLKELQKEHKSCANKFIVERNNLLQIICELHLMEKGPSDIKEEYINTMKRLNVLYVEAPSTSDKALKLASKALKEKEEYTFSDEEIDRFLPEALRGRIKGN